MTGSTRVAGVVPASGLSTRIGTAKALLDADGRSFLERVTAALAEGGCDPVYVVVREARGPVAARARTSGATVLLNPDPSDGPISSIRCAIGAFDPEVDGCAVCPVDHPLVEAATVARLLTEFGRTRPPILVPIHGGRRGHPTLFGEAVFPDLTSPDLEHGARTVVRRHADAVVELPVTDEGVLVDIDTLPEYRRRFPRAYRRRFQSR